jgi:hypothetical protein
MVLAEVRDLRRYLLLVEAEMVARGVVETAVYNFEEPRTHDTSLQRRYQVEMNDKEMEMLYPVSVRELYRKNEQNQKWEMLPEHREQWGK